MKIFLSYRRNDTGGRAGRLFDLLVVRFGTRNVFQDVNAVAPGLDFTAQVAAAIEASDVVLVVVGPDWFGEPTTEGRRRIDSSDDFVRQEVGQALAAGIPVVPVLVDDASLPPAGELPGDLAPLVLRQAVTLRDVSWHDDVDNLIRRLEGDHRIATGSRSWPVVLVGAGAVAAVAAVAAAVIVWGGNGDGSSDDSDGVTATNTSPISVPEELVAQEIWEETRRCAGGGRIELSAGPVGIDGGGMATRFEIASNGLQSDMTFNPIRVVDDLGVPYDEIDAGSLTGGFRLEQDGYGVTEHTATVSVNRDLSRHPGAQAMVLVVTGECDNDPILLSLTVPPS